MPKLEEITGSRTYGSSDRRSLAEIDPLDASRGDPVSFLGEGFFTGISHGVRNGLLIGAAVLAVGGLGLSQLIKATENWKTSTALSLDSDQLEFLKGRLDTKASLVKIIGNASSYVVEADGTVHLDKNIKNQLLSLIEVDQRSAYGQSAMEYMSLRTTLNSSDIKSDTPTKMKIVYDQLTTSYSKEWRRVYKLLNRTGDGIDVAAPNSFGKFPLKVTETVK